MLKCSLIALIFLVSGVGTRAQSADDIVNKYLDAIGGKDKISQVKSVQMESTVDVMGNEGPSTITILGGKGYRVESNVNGQKMVQVFSDQGGWTINPYMGSSEPQPLPEEMLKQNKGKIDPTGPLYNYAAKGNKVTFDGKEGDTYKLKVVTPDSIESELYIDANSYYLVKSITQASMMGQTMDVTTTFSDFKKSDFGLVFPYNVEISYGGQFSLTSKVKKITINGEVDPKIFEMPKS